MTSKVGHRFIEATIADEAHKAERAQKAELAMVSHLVGTRCDLSQRGPEEFERLSGEQAERRPGIAASRRRPEMA